MKQKVNTSALLAGLDGDLEGVTDSLGNSNQDFAPKPLELPAEKIMAGRKNSEPKQKRTIVLELDPTRCKRWAYYDRFEEWFSYENCKDLIDDIRTGEQEIPGIVRKLENDPDGYDYEVVFGGRRHFAAQYIGETFNEFKPFKAILRELSDREAARLMDLENRKRADISDFERCVSYRHQIGKTPGFDPIFSTLNELRAAIEAGGDSASEKDDDKEEAVGSNGRKLTKAALSYMITAGELNEIEELIVLFKGRRTAIPWTLAYKVMHQWNLDGKREIILAKAQELMPVAKEKSPEEILKLLLSAVTETKPEKKEDKPFYKEDLKIAGKVAVKATANDKNLALTIPMNMLKEVSEEELMALVKGIFAKVSAK